jgi:IclR family acetate operon transcriptional repressor
VATTAQTSSTGGMRSVHTALRIIEELSRSQPLGVAELARELGLPKSSAFRSLKTLAEAGWVRAETGEIPRWVLTTKTLRIGLTASSDPTLRDLASREMAAIRDAVGETVHLSIPDEGHLVVIARVDGTNSLRTFLELGTRAPIYATAGGRAMLAARPDQDIERLLDREMAIQSEGTATRAAIWDEIARARRLGYASNAAEWRTDIAALASAITSPTGHAAAAISISMPLTRYQELDHEWAGSLLRSACDRVRAGLQRR